jgi:hypothetical protein
MAGLAGFEPASGGIKTRCVRPLHHRPINGGESRIRTHGCFHNIGFQDRHLRPLSHLSIKFINGMRLPHHWSLTPLLYSQDRTRVPADFRRLLKVRVINSIALSYQRTPRCPRRITSGCPCSPAYLAFFELDKRYTICLTSAAYQSNFIYPLLGLVYQRKVVLREGLEPSRRSTGF